MDSGSGLESGARDYVGNIYTPMLRGNLAHTSTAIVSRERIEKVKQFDESLAISGEDHDFHFRTCKWGDVCFVDLSSTLYQVEIGDRLTLRKKETALNFLKTVQGAIAREKGNGTFPPAMIHEVLAEAHSWIAEELLKEKDHAGVRKHALLGLQYEIWQPTLICVLGVASVPRVISEPLLRSYRSCKCLISGSKRN